MWQISLEFANDFKSLARGAPNRSRIQRKVPTVPAGIERGPVVEWDPVVHGRSGQPGKPPALNDRTIKSFHRRKGNSVAPFNRSRRWIGETVLPCRFGLLITTGGDLSIR
jgi:hypothetical protein